jgi:hypothetical protein
MEIWKKIKDFDNYEVSSYGRVKRNECNIVYSNNLVAKYKLKYLKLEKFKRGQRGCYERVTLCKNNKTSRFMVHRLVAQCFIPNPHNKKCVNHMDGNAGNNRLDNLEWCTHSENERHSYDVLGKINANRKLSQEAVDDILNNCVKGTGNTNRGTVKEFANKYNVCNTVITNVLKKKYYVKTTRLSS